MELPTLISAFQLWWLLVLLPVLFWLAQPPRPRKLLYTAHPGQWRLAQEALRRRPPRFRALRWLLISLAALFATIAAAEPVLQQGLGPTRLFVLLDATASTGAKSADGEFSPFERSLAAVREVFAALPPHVDRDIAIARDGAITRRSGSASFASESLEPSGALPAPLSELAAAAARADTVVWTLSDAQAPASAAPAEGAFTSFGGRKDNAALASVTIEDRWPLGDFVLRARTVAFSLAPMQGTLSIEGAVRVAVQQPMTLQPGEPIEIEVPLIRTAEGGRLEVVLRVAGDALASDDVFSFELPPLPRTRIAVQGDETGTALAAKAGAALAEVTGGTVVEARPGEAVGFLLIEGGGGGVPVEPGPMLSFGRSRDGATPWPLPVGIDWKRSDPLFAGLDFSELFVAHALRDSLPDGEPLLFAQLQDGTTAPLAVVCTGQNGSAVHFAFRLQDSNLALLPAFPQLLLRAYERSQPGSRAIAVVQQPSPLSEADLRHHDATL
ncbi:MAG: hypothetical protein ABL997_13815, partial [Planctomycetota bacterium]